MQCKPHGPPLQAHPSKMTVAKKTTKTRKCGNDDDDNDVATESTSIVSIGGVDNNGAVANPSIRNDNHGRDTPPAIPAPLDQYHMTTFMDRQHWDYYGQQPWFLSMTTALLWMRTVLGLASLLTMVSLTERMLCYWVPSWFSTVVDTTTNGPLSLLACQFYFFQALHFWNSSPCGTWAMTLALVGTLGIFGSWVEECILDYQSKSGGVADLSPLQRVLQRFSPYHYPGPTTRQMLSRFTCHQNSNAIDL